MPRVALRSHEPISTPVESRDASPPRTMLPDAGVPELPPREGGVVLGGPSNRAREPESLATHDVSIPINEKLATYEYHFEFFEECEAELKNLIPQQRRLTVEALGLMYLAHDAADLAPLDGMVANAAGRALAYSPMTRKHYGARAAVLALQDKSGSDNTELSAIDFGAQPMRLDLSEKLGRVFEANMGDPRVLQDLVVMAQRLFPKAEIGIYANGHTRSIFAGIFSDHHIGNYADFDRAVYGEPSYDESAMSFPGLAGVLRSLRTELGAQLGTVALLGCGSGALEAIAPFIEPSGTYGEPSARYLVVSEEALSGSSTAWIDSLAPRNGYTAEKLARAMARSVFNDGVKEDPQTLERTPQVLAVLDLERGRETMDAVRAFADAATTIAARYPKAFIDARNHVQRMVGANGVDFSGQVDLRDFVDHAVRYVLRDALDRSETDPEVRAFLDRAAALVEHLDRFVLHVEAPSADLWGGRWEDNEVQRAHGLSFFWPGVTTDDERLEHRRHRTGRFSDLERTSELESMVPGFDGHGLTKLARTIDRLG